MKQNPPVCELGTVPDFGSEKLPSLSRNRPQYSILTVHDRFDGIWLFLVCEQALWGALAS